MNAAPPNPLLGTWHLRRWDIGYGDQRAPTLPFGADATGLIVYTGDGWMNACIARAGRARLSAESTRRLPMAEAAAAFESYFSYAGRYTLRVHEGRPQVVHQVTMSLNPNFVGSEQVRDMHFDAQGRLTLSASDTLPGSTVDRHHRLTWERR
jgi:Lipocalin-like domain